jgi:multiple antibiotic resistance protein
MSTVDEPLRILFGLLFTLVGPLKVISTFHSLTDGLETLERNRLALKASAYGALGIALAALMGSAQVAKFGISREAVDTAAGLLLAIVGLLPLIGIEKKSEGAKTPHDPLSLAFTVLVPPYAFGLILLVSLYIPSDEGQLGIVLVGVILMAMNAIAMMLAGPILKRVGITPLRIFGAVFGILQLSLGIQMLFWGIKHGMAAACAVRSSRS